MSNNRELPRAPLQYNGLALAYMGDAVFEIYIRRHLIQRGGTKAHLLHVAATSYVSARAQAKIINNFMESGILSEREVDIVKRGRNAKSGTTPKNTELKVYRLSTAFESLIGYLYLDEQQERMEELIYQGIEVIERETSIVKD